MVKFTSIFTGKEFFVKQYTRSGKKIAAQSIFPEMARAAITTAALENTTDTSIILHNLKWDEELVFDGKDIKVNIGLDVIDDGHIEYRVFSTDENFNPVYFNSGEAAISTIMEPTFIEMSALKEEKSDLIKGDAFYNELKRAGLEYTPGQQGIETLYCSENAVLAKITLHEEMTEIIEDYILHPVVIDAMFHSASVLFTGKQKVIDASIESISKFEILDTCVPHMWAYAQCDPQKNKGTYDIILCNDDGKVCARIYGLQFKQSAVSPGVLLFEPEWKEELIPSGSLKPDYDQHLAFIYSTGKIEPSDIESGIPGCRCILLTDEKPETIAGEFITSAGRIMSEIKKILTDIKDVNILLQLVITGSGANRIFSGLSGVIKSAEQEHPALKIQVIETETTDNDEHIISIINENAHIAGSLHVRYMSGKRYTADFKEITVKENPDYIPWKNNGVYLVSGGAGGIGRIITEDIAEKTENAVVFLAEKLELNEEKKNWIHSFEKKGCKINYRTCDLVDFSEVKKLIDEIKKNHKKLDGIIHCAGIIRDTLLVHKDPEEAVMVMNPKVRGLENLDKATKDYPIDFFILFSSISGVMGNAGQADYSAANAFLDAYALYRNGIVSSGKGYFGKTLSINWPLWKAGGMKIDTEYEKTMIRQFGMMVLETDKGLDALYHAVASGKSRIIVASGYKETIREKLFAYIRNTGGTTIVKPVGNGRRLSMKGLSVSECIELDLKEQVGKLLKIPIHTIHSEDNLADFGFDSIRLSEFAANLSDLFGITFSPSILFGYSTLEKLVSYLLQKYESYMNEFYAEDDKTQSKKSENIPDKKSFKKPGIRKRNFKISGGPGRENEPIAIIGMSGRFPEARNIDEMWKILIEGKNTVTHCSGERSILGRNDLKKWKCGWIPGVSEFDPLFFEISPLEAEGMDPRQRLLLQESWKALEDAGYGPEQMKQNKIGMFVGVEQGWYHVLAGDNAGFTANHDAVLAARLAYFLNFTGPVLSINTACSSGLVAVHQACLSLEMGECDTAIASGVNLMLISDIFKIMDHAGMLSEDGTCYAFDKRANGLAPGEAVAVVVLKKLSRALEDGDSIYAVIKGSGINYDGKTNGITAPSGVSQIDLLKTVYEKIKVNPEDIEYIVTHGTGTRLGDPVEVNALNDLFKSYTQKELFCALTSTKPNFGHSLAASGVVSLMALVMSLQHEMIPASINFDQKNEYINWDKSPFYINTKNKPWHDKDDKNRIGAVSSFGMSGTNAHVVVQSYSDDGKTNFPGEMPFFLLVFSAKNSDALLNRMEDMVLFLKSKNMGREELAGISYSLIKNRFHFANRCALVVRDVEDAVELLQKAIKNEVLPSITYGKKGKDFTPRDAIVKYISDVISQLDSAADDDKKYKESLYGIAELYCQGYDLPWSIMFKAARLGFIRIPTYPFAGETYWLNQETNKSGREGSIHNYLHPLLHENRSNFSEQRFCSQFTGDEFFLADHKVNGRKILPGVAYLEMIMAACEASLGECAHEEIRLKNITWILPVPADEGSPFVNISLEYIEDDAISFEVYSLDEQEEYKLHCEGTVLISTYESEVSPETIDINELVNREWTRKLPAAECYKQFSNIGIEYGPSHRGIEFLWSKNNEVVANIKLPPDLHDSFDDFIFHPSIMDAAFQSALGFIDDFSGIGALMPYSLEEVVYISPLSLQMWAILELTEKGNVNKLNIRLYNNSGELSVYVKGLSIRMIQNETGLAVAHDTSSLKAPEENQMTSTMLAPVWDIANIDFISGDPEKENSILVFGSSEQIKEYGFEKYSNTVMIPLHVNDTIEKYKEKLQQVKNIDHIVWIAPPDTSENTQSEQLIEAQEIGIIRLFRLIKALLELGYGEKILGWTIITRNIQKVKNDDICKPGNAGIEGLVGSLAKEYSNWKIRFTDLQDGTTIPIRDIFTLPFNSMGDQLAYRDGEWYARKLLPATYADAEKTIYRNNGVYVIIGGAGGIGEVYSSYLMEKYNANIVWIGRRECNEEIQAKIDRLASAGNAPIYISADAKDQSDMEKAYKEIKSRYKKIHGVIHSAIVLQDQSLANMTEERFRNGLSTKVDISVRLAQVFKKEPLDFILFFSSMQSFMKAAGQSNYAAGCTFKDAFAHMLAGECKFAVKIMNWGYWGSIGIVASEDYSRRMQKTGVGSIEPPEAMSAMEKLLAGPLDQVAFLKIINPNLLDEMVSEVMDIGTEGPAVDLNLLQQDHD